MGTNNEPQVTPDQSGQGSGDPPKYVTEEQLNRAMTSRFSAFEKKFEKTTGDLVTTVTGKLDELIGTKLSELTKKTEPPKAPQTPAESPEMKAMQKQLAEVQQQLAKANQEKEAERAAARDQSLRSTLQQQLTASGITGAGLRAAMHLLVDGEKRIRFEDDSDRILFKGDDGDLPLADGLKSWLKTDDAKIFLPPRGTQGSGDRGAGTRSPNNAPQPMRAGAALLNMALGTPTRE